MRNLRFGFFDDSGLPRESRILMFYSFDTEENLTRSGILHYHVPEHRFVGPRHDGENTAFPGGLLRAQRPRRRKALAESVASHAATARAARPMTSLRASPPPANAYTATAARAEARMAKRTARA